MTAEIAILNKTAVALAADSAVTIGRQKVYNSADKLFTLSKYHPVGIMIYGSAELTGVPWEVIIKIYRNELGKKSFSKLEDYSNDFIKFLNNGGITFSKQYQDSYMQSNTKNFFDTMIVKKIEKKVQKLIAAKEYFGTEDIARGIIEEQYKELQDSEILPSFSVGFISKFKKKYRGVINEIIKKCFEKIPLTSRSINQLVDLCASIHTRLCFPKRNVSGFVIAGFGEKEMFPSIDSFRVECVIENKLKYVKNEHQSIHIGDEFSASISPFAQDEMVHTILSGIDPDLETTSQNLLNIVFKDFPELIIEKMNIKNKSRRDALKKDFLDVSMGLFEDYKNRMIQYTRDKHVNPIVEMVQFLPKDELAAMAETLVNLTKFKRRITRDMETVGGPIDVAVISRGDGFVWIKRKHYFKPEFNHSFFQNYLGGE